MRYAEGRINRIFTIRLEDGDILPECLESFALQHQVTNAFCLFLGGVEEGSRIVVGPKDGKSLPPEPMMFTLEGVHEVAGTGTIFPDQAGNPKLHAHAVFGRSEKAVAGCIRPGIITWKTLEIVLIEVSGDLGFRVKDEKTGFTLYEPPGKE
jgi:predicted DNA-binding protein with PD1-like motif